MIEITTGVIFLMSSLYGAGNADTHVEKINEVSTPQAMASAVQLSLNEKKNDPKFIDDTIGMKEYLEDQFKDTPLLVDIARCESNFKQFDAKGRVIRGNVDDADIGVMQINERYHLETAMKLGYDIHTVDGNIAYAKYLYGKSGSKPWSASAKCWSKGVTATNEVAVK